MQDFKIRDEKMLDKVMSTYSDDKVTFAKIHWGTGKGPYIVAFPNSMVRDYCECNAYEFKTVNINDVKTDTLPLWECGNRLPEQINALPKLNMKLHREKLLKLKDGKRKAKATK
jgi:hypothetical protein